MIIQLITTNAFINTDHISLVRPRTAEQDTIDGEEISIPKGADIRFSDGTWVKFPEHEWRHIEHYLRLQYLKDSAEVCGKLGIEEEE